MNRYWAAVRVMAIGAALGGSVALSQTRSADEDCLVLVRSEVLPVRISFDTGAALTLTPSEDARSVSLRPGARTLEARAGGKVLRKPFEPRGDRYLLWIGADDSWEAEQAESPPASASPAPESGDRAGKETGPGVVIILLVCAAVLGLGLCLRPGLRHLLAVRESSPSPPPLADVTYVVFCRLTGLKGMAADTVAAHCEALATAICTACGGDRSYRTYSSVYGRFVLVPSRGGAALELAVRIHQRCAAAGMRVAIAIAAGRVEATRDLLDDNVAGVAINRAARLAHLPGGTGRVAVDEFTFRDVTGGCSAYSKSVFDPLQHGQVKRTRLKYAWFRCRTPAVGKPPAPCGRHECVTAHVVAYDIVQYSDRDARDQVQVVEDLSHAVRRALEAAGGRPGGANLWYAPAGDGGVVVFRSCSG
ncbi:MAG TPA: hypothetical protein VD866_19680, partial [Urbifossiella sp.]|nr:hypothetical protein [Urbifossiella sp.]